MCSAQMRDAAKERDPAERDASSFRIPPMIGISRFLGFRLQAGFKKRNKELNKCAVRPDAWEILPALVIPSTDEQNSCRKRNRAWSGEAILSKMLRRGLEILALRVFLSYLFIQA